MISRKRTLSLRSRRTCFPYALEHKSSLAGEGGQPNQHVFVLNLERAMGIELYPQSTSLCDLTALPPPSASNGDRKSTRLNSSHGYISYAVFCLKKKKHHISTYLYQH